jgi:DNA-binding response OmpR family regulator
MKVLVIEDEPQIRDIFAEFVALLGHEADVAVDGAMAWRASTRSSTRSWSRTSSCRG